MFRLLPATEMCHASTIRDPMNVLVKQDLLETGQLAMVCIIELGQCASQRAMTASHASHGCEAPEPTWRAMRINMSVTQLLKANRFKMGA